MSRAVIIVWFRQDLRVIDHPALTAAVDRGDVIIPVYIWSPEEEGDWPMGAAGRWWLHHALARLDEALQGLGSCLVLRKGTSLEVLRTLISQTRANRVCWCRRYAPAGIVQDNRIMTSLQTAGTDVEQYGGHVLFEPESVQTQSGNFYQVFSPFWKACLSLPEPEKPLEAPEALHAPDHFPDSLSLDQLALLPEINWTEGMRSVWQSGRASAMERLDHFIGNAVSAYPTARDRPDILGTSRLSPHLHFGEISVRQIWYAVRRRAPDTGAAYLRQLGWRDFSTHLLFHVPETTDAPLKPEFESFEWREDKALLCAWQQGHTGYPLVDAGMRELWATGWMHNRVRMVAASFLVKHLRISWIEGARWFWNTLVDADLANNTMGWQWVAGCGADAAPYFRIFNPILQSKKYDPSGSYIRRWVPELAALSDTHIHIPWKASKSDLTAGAVILGETYPKPIVDHMTERDRALSAYQQMKDRSRLS
jgi:deoxyribodipyrimidine photo-lyase